MIGRPPLLGPLALVGIFIVIIFVYWPTVHTLVTHYDSYWNAGVVVAAFFVISWNMRFELAILPIMPARLGLIGLLGLGFIWLVGELLFIRLLTYVAVIGMVSLTVLALLGYRWLVALLFPLAFLVFAIPIVGPLMPTLLEWTATAAVFGLQATGVPIYRDGAYFIIPSGSWSVAESCSGIGYFTTCLMLGILYAWAMYGTPVKRIAFATGAIFIGVVGNWVRVYLTVLIAHLSDNRLLRDGHDTFGWILFAIILMGYGWIGHRFRDHVEVTPGVDRTIAAPDASTSPEHEVASRWRVIFFCFAALATLLIWPLAKNVLDRPSQLENVEISDIKPAGGWVRVTDPAIDWLPELQNPSLQRTQIFEKTGNRVGVYVAIFRNQSWTSKLVTSVNELARADNPNWTLRDRGAATTEYLGRPLNVDTGVLFGRGKRIVAWRWYWIDGVVTAGGSRAKLQQVAGRIKGLSDAGAWVAIYTEANESYDAGIKPLNDFVHDMASSMERALAATVQR